MEVADYLEFMVKNQASDLFFSTGSPVMVKIEGITHPINNKLLLKPGLVKQLAYSLMSDQHIKQFEADWEANLGVSISNLGRFRVNVLRQRGEVSMVVRYIKHQPPTIKELNLPDYLEGLVMEPRGLILVAGATGSGKSTTLASMIDYRNQETHSHILTIEDPIEYLYQYKKSIVNQREIGTDTKSYSSALRNAMREAPDVILIGEIRDQATMHSAITYAETGHLCLATIHASNSIETLDRVLNFFPDNNHKQLLFDLSKNLKAIVCQRLIKGLDGMRWPALELMQQSPYISELIQRGKLDEMREAIERNIEGDIETFDQSVIKLYQNGHISKQEAINNADSKHNVTVKLRLLESGNHQTESPKLVDKPII